MIRTQASLATPDQQQEQAKFTAAQLEFFETRVRPVLAQRCYHCHGPQKQESGLRTDSRAALLAGGDSGAAIVPGQPDEGYFIDAVRYGDIYKMPKDGKLPDDQIADLVAWVEMGAPWPDEDAASNAPSPKEEFDLAKRSNHWSFLPLDDSSSPPAENESWSRTWIDPYVLYRLDDAGLPPSPEADRATWLRRVTFDLTGLPPTPEEANDFLHDPSPQAHERVVDRLLASPQYGERWARHWLDLVRYAETAGHEFDYDIPLAFQYRDYAIRAFNEDVPYDQFVREHIAGDLLEQPRRRAFDGGNESIIAPGFWWLGEGKHSPVDIRAEEADRVDNQLDVFGKAFLGLTIACARCHDHKFDAISTRDYYALAGYLQSSRYHEASVDPPEEREQIAAALEELAEERDQILRKGLPSAVVIAEDRADTSSARAPTSDDIAQQSASAVYAVFNNGVPDDWFVTDEAFGASVEEARRLGFTPTDPPRVIEPGVVHSGRLSNRFQGTLRSPTFVINSPKIFSRLAGRGTKLNLIIAGYQRIRDPIYGGLTIGLNHDELRWHTQDVSKWIGQRAYVEIIDHGDGWAAVDEIRFGEQLDAETAAGAPSSHLNEVLLNDGRIAPDELAVLESRRRGLEERIQYAPRAMTLADGNPVDEFVFIRGNHKTAGDVVARRFLEAFSGADQEHDAAGSGRVALAERMFHDSRSLISRALANRVWQHHFGTGLAASSENFGRLGDPPTHPKLLDALARELIQNGWRLKPLHRAIVLSATYRQVSDLRADANTADPANLLLHRMPVKRLEAEAVRDSILAASGRLERGQMYGPGVPPHLTPFMQGRGRPGVSGPLDGDGRRSLYLGVRRNFLTPFLTAFDFPTPFTTIARRDQSNVPAQALTLMNDPFVLAEARRWAERVLGDVPVTAAAQPNQDGVADTRATDTREADIVRLRAMYLTAYGRAADEDELTALVKYVAVCRGARQSNGRDQETAIWADVAHALICAKEFVYMR